MSRAVLIGAAAALALVVILVGLVISLYRDKKELKETEKS